MQTRGKKPKPRPSDIVWPLRKQDGTAVREGADPFGGAGGLSQPGPPGVDGLDGDAGPPGELGPQGPLGPVGATGAMGAPGPPGLDGDDGLNGEEGPMGPAGPIGPVGDIGPMGMPGPPGLDGDDGLNGEEGPMGPTGPVGPAGTAGAIGAMGLSGPPGVDGLDGDDGPPGAAGRAGAAGTMGPPGRDGDDSEVLPCFLGPTMFDAAAIFSGAFVKARQHAQTAYLDAANVFAAAGNSFSEILGVAKGLQFPAAQVASAGANDLDDYEEGSWTPIIGGSTSETGQTYSATVQVGRYVKIGRWVVANFGVQFGGAAGNKGTIVGNLLMKGLPFTVENLAQAHGTFMQGFFTGLAVAKVNIAGLALTNTTTFTLYGNNAAALATAALVTADINDAFGIYGSVIYRATA